jgi:hypothetical protein
MEAIGRYRQELKVFPISFYNCLQFREAKFWKGVDCSKKNSLFKPVQEALSYSNFNASAATSPC